VRLVRLLTEFEALPPEVDETNPVLPIEGELVAKGEASFVTPLVIGGNINPFDAHRDVPPSRR